MRNDASLKIGTIASVPSMNRVRSGRKTFTVFARFRRTRLTLARALPSLDAAMSFARQVRSVRFHDPEHVFVVDDETGETVAEPAPSSAQDPSSPGE